MKYIIEIEDEPLVRKSALHGENAIEEGYCIMSLKHTPPTVVLDGDLDE